MDYFRAFQTQFRNRLTILIFTNNLLILVDWWLAVKVFQLTGWWLVAVIVFVPILTVGLLPWLCARYFTQPTKLLWQAILHILPDSHNIPAPKLEEAYFGRELVKRLANNVYQLAIDGAKATLSAESQLRGDLKQNVIASKLPLPLFILDRNANITYVNPEAVKYVGVVENELVGKNFYTAFDLAFSDTNTLDSWLQHAQASSVSASSTWHRVRTTLPSKETIIFDLAASYSKDDPNGHELMLIFFDRTAMYGQDDQALSFIALAVHELRTPLSILLGYIELFETELGNTLDEEHRRYMSQMKSAGQNLSSFVSNILTVARIENNQLELKLTEEDWPGILTQAVNEMKVRAQVQGMSLELTIDKDLPKVGANPVTASEVVINLIDNAIKYSRTSSQGQKVIIHAGLDRYGLVETTVQDFGVGIPQTVLPNLFQKFQRSFRSRSNITGTGLGLYLSRLIIEAHGGHIWVHSQEGKGATFGFTLQPYAMLATELKNSNNTDIVRSAHGWVKNHSLYRS